METKTLESDKEVKVVDTEQPKEEKIYDDKWELKDKKTKSLTCHIIKVWSRRFCRDAETIQLEKTENHLTLVTTSIDAWLDFTIMWGSIEKNGFPRMKSELEP